MNKYLSNTRIQELTDEGDRIANSMQLIGSTIEAYSIAYDVLHNQLEAIKEELNHYQPNYPFASHTELYQEDNKHEHNMVEKLAEDSKSDFTHLSSHHKIEVYDDEGKEFNNNAIQQHSTETKAKLQIPSLQESKPRYDVDVEHSIQNSNKIAEMATPSNEVSKKPSFIERFKLKKKIT